LYTGPSDDPTAAICARVESEKRCGEAGWLHRLRDERQWRSRRRPVRIAAPSNGSGSASIDFQEVSQQAQSALPLPALTRLADDLGLEAHGLQRLGIGWIAAPEVRQLGTKCSGKGCVTFPMTDAAGKLRGIRLRSPSGFKYSVSGGRQGLFIPSDLPETDLLLIGEGPTDTAALLDLDFAAVGRPSCTGGTRLLVDLVHRLQPSEIVVVADSDGPGRRGAESLATALVAYCFAVRVIAPADGIKDARQWKRSGATTDDVLAVIQEADPRRLQITSRRR
jgi:phage/plasmid primase-like uncharacterized protein